MRKSASLFAVALFVAACGGGGDAESTDTSADPLPTTQATSAPTTDQSVVTTAAVEAPATTAAEETTTTVEEANPMLEAALAAAGSYSGSWTNTTFGSTGDASMQMTVTDDGDIGMEWDLGGFVFGASDPDGEGAAVNIDDLAGGRIIPTTLFGDVEVNVGADFATLTLDAEDVPAPGIQAFRATAMWNDDGSITGTYVVEFEGDDPPAEGTFEMTRS